MPVPGYDPTVYQDALEAAKFALGMDSSDTSRDKALGFALAQTKVGDTFRPYAAAYDWLSVNPKWLEEAPGEATYRGSVLSLPYLAARQAREDARLELDVPGYFSLEPDAPYSGPVPMVWRP